MRGRSFGTVQGCECYFGTVIWYGPRVRVWLVRTFGAVQGCDCYLVRTFGAGQECYFGTVIWYGSGVRVRFWYGHLVRSKGASATWYGHLVRLRGAIATWYGCLVRLLGAVAWCGSKVRVLLGTEFLVVIKIIKKT